MTNWRDVADSLDSEQPWSWPEKAAEDAPIEAATYTDGGATFPVGGGGYNGENFYGGVQGQIDEISTLDYWTLRQRSAALFYTNSYGRGIIRRFVTDIINTGLEVEVCPEETMVGLSDDALVTLSNIIETRYKLYGSSPEIIDAKGSREDGELQAQIYTEALIEGDCLVIKRQDEATGLPQIQIVTGSRVRTPPMEKVGEARVVDGVHLDKRGRHLGYWVYLGTAEIDDDEYVYIAARGKQSGRKTAWMVYGIDKREDGVRGEPLLSIAIQPLKSISNYRDAAQLKADINAMIIGFVKRSEDKPASLGLASAAQRKGTVTGDATGATAPVDLVQIKPGVWMSRLQPGEEPVPYSHHGTDVNFGTFEASIMVGLAWALGVPPEVLMMSFNKAYSASQAANNKWKTLGTKERKRFARQHCKNLYEEFFITELLAGKLLVDGFIDAYLDPKQYDLKRAWLRTQWHGPVEPSSDIVKTTNGYTAQMAECLITAKRSCRELNGSKYDDNVRQRKKEIQMKMDAVRPILEAQKEFGEKQVNDAMAGLVAVAYKPDTEEDPDVANAASRN